MRRLKPELEPSPNANRRWRWRLLWLLPLIVFAVLIAERWRGKHALASWSQNASKQGESLRFESLWPAPSAANREFSNQFARVGGELPSRLKEYSGQLSGIIRASPGTARRGSQEPQPPIRRGGNRTNTWEDLESLIDDSESGLESLRELLKTPARSMGYEVNQLMETPGLVPNFVHVRFAAQALHAATLTELHRGDLEGALKNLEALAAFNQLYADEPSLVSFMIRVAVLGLSDDVCWDALQAEGWSEPQLARLQRACEYDLLAQMPKTMEVERAVRLASLRWFASHSYEDWLGRYQEVYQTFGYEPPTCDTGPAVRRSRQWVFHPLWRFAWADQEKLLYLQTVQGELEILREFSRHRNWTELDQQLAEHYDSYRPPTAAWRYYIKLPLVDWVSDADDTSATPVIAYPYADSSRAWFTTMRNLTWHEMVNTAIAVKRFHLRYGAWPRNLSALIPEFLPALPRDLMNGDVLCYFLNWDGGFTVYSVGENGRDDAGDPTSGSFRQTARDWSPWHGRDWVWPRGVAQEDAGGQANEPTGQPGRRADHLSKSQQRKSFLATYPR